MRSLRSFLLYSSTFTLTLISPKQISAQIIINEICPASDPEWVELYNFTDNAQTLTGCTVYLDDNHTNKQKVTFTNESINPKDFHIIQKGTLGWNSNWLNNNGDQITLTCPSLSDTIAYGNQQGATLKAPKKGTSIGRFPDGSDNILLLSNPSKGLPNPAPQTPPPKPTIAPTPIQIPSIAPSEPPITSKPNPSLETKSTNTGTSLQPLAIVPQSKTPSPQLVLAATLFPSPPEDNSNAKVPAVAIPLIGLGLISIAAALYPFIKKQTSDYNSSHEHN